VVDVTVLAQKVISAVTHLEERFGAGYVVDVLRGSKSARIQDRHKGSKTFGIGADVSKEEWNEVIRDLVAQHYLSKSEGLYPLLRLTSSSAAVLEGSAKVTIARMKEKIVTGPAGVGATPYEDVLFQQLKNVRRQLAVRENVPAYIVLSDATLMELATYLPHDEDEFRKISGFGEVKIEKYGKAFCDIVTAYCMESKLTSRIHLKVPKRIRNERPEPAYRTGMQETDTKQQSLDLFLQGHLPEKIAALRGFSRSTIEGHLAFYVQQGKLALDQVMDISRVPAIQKAIEQSGGKMIAPIKESLGENYSYGEIRMVMGHLEFLTQRG
jgi:ATP-dependent DNA helicase RecQ